MKFKITAAFAGTLAGLALLFAPSADASQPHIPQRMYNAVEACHSAPGSYGRALCQSLYLRPHLHNIADGPAVVEECFDMAADEARPGSKVWAKYVQECFRGNILVP